MENAIYTFITIGTNGHAVMTLYCDEATAEKSFENLATTDVAVYFYGPDGLRNFWRAE